MPKESILIADDDQVTVRILTAQLKAQGFNVIVAFDAMQAWMRALDSLPTAILLDITMPGGTGLEVLEKLKTSAKTNPIPVIVVSASTDPQLPKTVKELGADDFLSKPIDFERLQQTLRRVLGKLPASPQEGAKK